MPELPALAGVEALEARLQREFSDEEMPRVESVLEDASDLVREAAGDELKWPDPATAPRIARLVTLRCAERAVRNPEGFSSESAGDYSYQRNGATGEGGLYLTDKEVRSLRKAGGHTGLWTQPTTRGPLCDSGLWLEDSFGCELFPVGDG